MDPRFRDLIESLDPKFQALVGMPPVKYKALPSAMPKRGIYLFSEDGSPLYVGRTNRLRQRLQNHCLLSGTHFTATFAFRIARRDSGKIKASYSKKGSRSALTDDPNFARAFDQAKQRVADMDIRYIEEPDPTRSVSE